MCKVLYLQLPADGSLPKRGTNDASTCYYGPEGGGMRLVGGSSCICIQVKK